MAEFVLKRVENIEGKADDFRHQDFPLFLQCLQKVSPPGTLTPGTAW